MTWKRALSIAVTLLAGLPLVAAGTPPVNDTGTTAWMLTSTALVLLMVPGLAMFYGGLVRTKNVLGTMMHSFAAMAVVGVLWTVVGYALSFGPNALGGLIGWDRGLVLLRSIDHTIMPAGVPEYAFAMFQGKFAIITPALIAGAVAERITFRGWVAFITLWVLFVYCPLCHWVWAPDGYFFNLGAKGAIDFAGGTVVHISSGVAGLALALFLGGPSRLSQDRHGAQQPDLHPHRRRAALGGLVRLQRRLLHRLEPGDRPGPHGDPGGRSLRGPHLGAHRDHPP